MAAPTFSKYRWTICGLVFFATTINYLDRAVISLLKTYLEKDFLWTESDYSHIVIGFQLAYSLGMIGIGRFIDMIGTKSGYALSLLLWSIAAIGHALVKSTFGFIVARAALGVSESGNFPAAIKTVAEWFPKKERALATGIFNSGANVGAIIAPLTVPFIAEKWGWKWAFIITGLAGLLWLIFWYWLYEIPAKQKRLSKAEFDYIHSDREEEITMADKNANNKEVISSNDILKDVTADTGKSSWLQLLELRPTWAFVLGKFLTDPVWWFYLFWLPSFLKAQYGLQGTATALPIALVYTMASAGSIFGGWLPLYFIKKGWPVYRSRKTSMFIYALFAIPVIFAQLLGSLNMWLAVLIIGLAASAHQAWSANIFTTVSDMFPKKAVASVTGIGGMAGGLGGIVIAWLAGGLFDHYKALGRLETGYYIMFFICGSSYIIAWFLMHLLTPKMKEVKV